MFNLKKLIYYRRLAIIDILGVLTFFDFVSLHSASAYLTFLQNCVFFVCFNQFLQNCIKFKINKIKL